MGKYIAAGMGLQRGDWTDDTLLAATTARAIVKAGGLDINTLAKESALLYQTIKHLSGPLSASSVFGFTTKDAFENLLRGVPPEASASPGNSKSPGNAPALKMAPVGLYMYATGKYKEGIEFAEAAGQMTHVDPRSVASGVVQAHAIYTLLHGITKDAFLQSVVNVCQTVEHSQDKTVTLLDRLRWVLENKNIDEEDAYKELGPGWAVTRNYPFALWMFQKYWDNPIEGLVRLVNYGGDSDSTAAIYGALAGARGIEFPKNWVDTLRDKEELNLLASEVASFSQQ